jgi:SAM-dependent methyltransferase
MKVRPGSLAPCGRHDVRQESYWRFLLRCGLKNAAWFGDYCRFREVGLIAGELAARAIHSLLDVGCAGTLFPYYVGRLFPQARVIGIDSGENLALAPTEMGRIAACGDTADRVRLFPADARRLPFRDGSFDAATAVSVLEHIRGEGDIVAMREMARVVRPGGLIALSVPMGARAVEQEADASCPYFIRRYDAETLSERLIRAVRSRSVTVRYFGETRVPYSAFYVALRSAHARWCQRGAAWKPLRYLSWAALALTPLASKAFLRVWDPQSPTAEKQVPGGAVVVLEKDGREMGKDRFGVRWHDTALFL